MNPKNCLPFLLTGGVLLLGTVCADDVDVYSDPNTILIQRDYMNRHPDVPFNPKSLPSWAAAARYS